jgi:uncharacterized membrane protein
MPRPAFAAALAVLITALASGAAYGQATEKCFGVARAGQNDGIGDDETPGRAEVDFQGDAWTWVPAGRCLTLPLPDQPDGTPRRGSQQPLDRDRP